MKLEDLTLKQTCDCCPEQYDVIYNKDRIGYIHYRHGIFTCQPVIKNEIQYYYLVYESFKNWHLTLYDDHREELLLKSKRKLVEFWNDFKNIKMLKKHTYTEEQKEKIAQMLFDFLREHRCFGGEHFAQDETSQIDSIDFMCDLADIKDVTKDLYELVMNEYFVPYELAVKLGEKGFNYKCLYVYNKEQIINPEVIKAFGELTDDGYYELTKEGGGKLDWSFVYINKCQLIQYRDVIIPNEMIRAPTISQVLKWLREEKEVYVSVIPEYNEFNPVKGVTYRLEVAYWKDDEFGYETVEWLDKETHTIITFDSYEKALLEEIEYVIDNLI